MLVEKVSEVTILPSSPNPSHFKIYNVSLLDQFAPLFYTPLIIYYSNQEESIASIDYISKRSQLLKLSLSQTLSRFYPLAGKIKDDHSIDCNDEGVYYVEARADISLSEHLKEPLTSLVNLHTNADLPTPGSYVVKIQETTFSCGGFAIGVLISHMISDGVALSSFLKDWAAMTCQSDKEISYPYLDSPSIFLPSDVFSKEEASMLALIAPLFKKMKVNPRRFVFTASAIAKLKDKAINLGVENPTRVEVVSSLLTKCLMATFKARSKKDKPLAIAHAVNLRRRAVPQFPECSLGNFVWSAGGICDPKESELGNLVCKMREAIGKTNGDFVKKLQGDGGYVNLCEMIKETREVFGNPEKVDFVCFSSWCNFGLYEIDFGWGKPVWSSYGWRSNTEMVFVNAIVLMDAPKEKEIEVWVCLDEDDVLLLEKDEELLSYICFSLDPNP